jgi:hypothetical protein
VQGLRLRFSEAKEAGQDEFQVASRQVRMAVEKEKSIVRYARRREEQKFVEKEERERIGED